MRDFCGTNWDERGILRNEVVGSVANGHVSGALGGSWSVARGVSELKKEAGTSGGWGIKRESGRVETELEC